MRCYRHENIYGHFQNPHQLSNYKKGNYYAIQFSITLKNKKISSLVIHNRIIPKANLNVCFQQTTRSQG